MDGRSSTNPSSLAAAWHPPRPLYNAQPPSRPSNKGYIYKRTKKKNTNERCDGWISDVMSTWHRLRMWTTANERELFKFVIQDWLSLGLVTFHKMDDND